MNRIICDKCNESFAQDTLKIMNELITKDEQGENVIEHYFECPICKAHYTVTIMDRKQELMLQKRKQFTAAVKEAVRAGQLNKVIIYQRKGRELSGELIKRAKMLKEKYKEYMEK